jgi:hypothetical protein
VGAITNATTASVSTTVINRASPTVIAQGGVRGKDRDVRGTAVLSLIADAALPDERPQRVAPAPMPTLVIDGADRDPARPVRRIRRSRHRVASGSWSTCRAGQLGSHVRDQLPRHIRRAPREHGSAHGNQGCGGCRLDDGQSLKRPRATFAAQRLLDTILRQHAPGAPRVKAQAEPVSQRRSFSNAVGATDSATPTHDPGEV